MSRTERRSRRSLESCGRSRWMISIRLDGELSKWHTAWLAAHLRHCATHAAALCDLVDRIRSSPLEQSDTVISAPRRSAQLADTTRAAVVAVAAAAFTSVAALLGKHPRREASSRPTAASRSGGSPCATRIQRTRAEEARRGGDPLSTENGSTLDAQMAGRPKPIGHRRLPANGWSIYGMS